MEPLKRVLLLILTLSISVLILAACDRVEDTEELTKGSSSSIFGPETDALKLFVRNNTKVAESLTKQFPDILFDFYYYDGQNTTSALKMLLENDDIGDIYLGTLQLDDETAKEHLLKLSGYSFCDNYEISVLNQYDVDGSIYQVPAGIIVRSIMYNRDMFDKYGWKEPQSFTELVELCKQIRREAPDITPIVFGGAAVGYYFTTMTTYAQTEFLYTPEGEKWEKAYQQGNAKAEDGFGIGIQMTQELIDAGAFDVDKNDKLWDNSIYNQRMETGEAAMMFAWGGQDILASGLDRPDSPYELMPFRNYAGDPFLGTQTSFHIGLAKCLEDPGNEKKLENAIRVMEWFATREGMMALSGENKSMIYPIKGLPNSLTQAKYLKLWNDNLNSIKSPMLYAGYEDILPGTAEYIIEAMKGNCDLSGLAEFIDAAHKEYLEDNSGSAVAGSFKNTFSHEETVQLFANILYEKGGGDIAMVSNGERRGDVPNTRGVNLKFYEGKFLKECATCQVPGSPYNDPAVRMTLTGETIQKLLECGKRVTKQVGKDGLQKGETVTLASDYPYYFAGMLAEFENGKVISMKLNSGDEIKMDQTYTVIFAANDFADDIKARGNPEALGYSCYDAMLEYLEKNSPVSSPKVLRLDQ